MKKKRNKKNILTLVLVLSISIITFTFDYLKDNKVEVNFYEVVRIVDGDTIRIIFDGKEEPLRLIGIDTPESVHPDEEKNSYLGSCATAYIENLLYGKQVTLEFDVTDRDRYGRLLAYVYIDGVMLNKTLVEDGYAQVSTYPPNVKYAEDFVELEQIARDNNRGLWNEENCQEPIIDVINNNDLPLKALCNDNSYVYATNSEKNDYRGMCTGHGGIKEELGRVE